MNRLLVPLMALVGAVLSACAPLQQGALKYSGQPKTGFSDNWFTSFDGARLGLSTWKPTEAAKSDALNAQLGPMSEERADGSLLIRHTIKDERGRMPPLETVIIAVHGMNDYAGAFNAAGKFWSEHGVTVYAYDQRGHGRSPQPGIWPQHDVMRQDLKTAVAVARRLHPDARIAVVGESMGASVAITAFADPDPPDADVLILSGPGLRGWGALPWFYSVSLWTSSHVRPGWIVVPPKGVHVVATDNNDKLREMWNDKYVLKDNRIDSVYGVVSIMEEADAKISKLPKKTPTLLLYGANDQVIPPFGVERAAKKLPAFVKTAYYKNGYHMLMNDKQAPVVWADILGFIDDPKKPLLSGSPPLPWVGAPAQAVVEAPAPAQRQVKAEGVKSAENRVITAANP
jgi:alpha-beta hydrolase superfamily lysophospholipase